MIATAIVGGMFCVSLVMIGLVAGLWLGTVAALQEVSGVRHELRRVEWVNNELRRSEEHYQRSTDELATALLSARRQLRALQVTIDQHRPSARVRGVMRVA